MREMLDAATSGVVRAADLETATGLDRYEAARQFRRALWAAVRTATSRCGGSPRRGT